MKKTPIKILGLLMIFLMLPVFAGSICPCAHAAPATYPVFDKAACRGCCTQMNAAKSDCEKEPEIQAGMFRNTEVFPVDFKLQKGAGDILAAKVLTDLSPPAEDFHPVISFASHEPLFLSLLNLRL